MDLTLGPEQETIRDAIRSVLDERLPIARVRAMLGDESPFDAQLWREAAGLGWFGLGLPEACGGAAYGLAEEMLLFIELGRALAPGPWLGTVLAAHAVGGDVLRGILEGTHHVALVDDPGPLHTGDVIDRIPDAAVADAVLLLGPRGAAHAGVDAIATTAGIDPTRPLARIRLASAPASLDTDVMALRRTGMVLAAAEAVGIAERTLEMSVAYAKVRQQFGRPIGSFQAVKHRCADMAVRTEVARSVVTYAAVAVPEGDADADRHVHVAKALATDAALANAADNLQNHGGMGYTWEGDAHLYLKRAWMLEHELGARVTHLDALIASART